jgi:multidrug resistance efflux pump
MKKKVKWIIAGIAAAVTGVFGVVALTAPIEAETVTVTSGYAAATFTEQGVYAYARSYTVYPLVSGEVLEVRVKDGDTVEAGDVLAVVDAVDYREQIGQLRAGIDGYGGQIANLGQQERQARDTLTAQLAGPRGQLATVREAKAKNTKNADS